MVATARGCPLGGGEDGLMAPGGLPPTHWPLLGHGCVGHGLYAGVACAPAGVEGRLPGAAMEPLTSAAGTCAQGPGLRVGSCCGHSVAGKVFGCGSGETLVTVLLPEAGRPQARISFCRQRPAGCGHQPSSSWAWGRAEHTQGLSWMPPACQGCWAQGQVQSEGRATLPSCCPGWRPREGQGNTGEGRSGKRGWEGGRWEASTSHTLVWVLRSEGQGGRGGVVPILRAQSSAHPLRLSLGTSQGISPP